MSAESSSQKQKDEQLREHYEIERGLADQLRSASQTERRTLYTSLYDELYRRVPYHPQLVRKISPRERDEMIQSQMKLLAKLLNKDTTYLEVGPGDCALAFAVAKTVKKVYAVDVSETITESSRIPENFELMISDGCSIPVPENSVDVVFSNQLMEHLHPDDANEQLKNIFDCLAPGGTYLCVTPNRLNGPHDISQHFDNEATGFHLKEYTVFQLSKLFKEIGFSKMRQFVGFKGRYFKIPIFPVVICERLLDLLPNGLKKKLAGTTPVRQLIDVHLAGVADK